MAQLGISVEEAVSNGLNVGSNVSTRNIGMLMARLRGVANKPTLVTTPKEDNLIFGGFDSSMYSPFVMKNLFDNLSGFAASVFGVRIVGAGSVAATANIVNAYPNLQSCITTVFQVATALLPQINKVTIGATIEVGDEFKITIGATTITFTAITGSTPTSVAAGLAALFNASVDAGFTPITASSAAGVVTLTADAVNTPFTQTSSSLNNALSTTIFEVWAGREGQKDVGTWANGIVTKLYPKGDPNGLPNAFLYQVILNGVTVESHSNATIQGLIDSVNGVSDYNMLVAVNPAQVPVGVLVATLAGGVYNAPVDADFEPAYDILTSEPMGMAIFESVDVQLLCCPEVMSTSFAVKCEAFAKDPLKKKRFFVFNMPYLATETIVESYYNALQTNEQSFAGGYLPWCEVDNNTGGKIWIPAIGYVLGAGYVRVAGLNDGRVWTPPAGLQSRATGIYRFTHDTLTDQTLDRYAKQWHVNVVKLVKSNGYNLWSSRTYSDNPLYHSVHIRLMTNWLLENLEIRNARFIQKLNTSALRNDMRVDTIAFMRQVYSEGGIENSISFDKAVTVTVTTSVTDRKNVFEEVDWIPTETVEALRITLSRNDGALVVQG